MRDLAIEPHEAELVRKIFQMTVNEGYGSHQLAEYAKNAGYRTHNGAEFQSNTIRRILKNEIYIGYIVNENAKSNRIETLRIVSDEDFNFAQEILSQRTRTNDEKRTIAMSNKGRALLSGNIFCAHCGCRLATSRYKERYIKRDGTSSGTEYTRYICYHRSRGLNDCDGASTYNAERVDSAVMDVMRKIFANISGCPEEEKIQEAYKNAMAANHAMCKYRLDQTICTVKTCHLDGQNRPCSRSTIPLLFQTPRRNFSTVIAACRLYACRTNLFVQKSRRGM